MLYQVDIIFDGDGEMRMTTIREFDFLKAIEKTEEFFERNYDLSPEILSARQHSDTDIQDIKLKVVQTINERRN